MEKISLLFGIHMHQPVDNFDEAVDNAVKLCYAPFFEIMRKYPEFKFAVHCSGWLLEKIKNSYPKLFENIYFLTKNNSIEWLSGAYYEAILSAIPSKDRVMQINKLSNFIYENFSVKPKGLWIAERVWDNSLIKDLNSCNIEYAIVDDYHFLTNGYDKDKMNGYYKVENNFKELKLFPISRTLRYALPFSKVQDSLNAILNSAKEPNKAAIFFDDAEKFGLWPDTNKWVYQEKWLEDFIKSVLKNKKIKTMHYQDYIQKNKSLDLAYLNNCSYSEMCEWSLNLKDAKRLEELKNRLSVEYIENKAISLIKGNIWENFFKKYHESNYLHKRVLYLSKKKKSFDEKSLNLLYKAQTNDAYWHGVFGGFYLPSLRDNTYRYILEIEKLNLKNKQKVEFIDIDKDDFKELKVLTKSLSVVISAKNGAQIIEFGSLDALFNWQNTIKRREELYHNQINQNSNSNNKEVIATIHNRANTLNENLRKELIYDWHQKNSFIEHFSTKAFTFEDFKNLTYQDIADFANSAFEYKNSKFIRKSFIKVDNKKYPAKMLKKYSFLDNKIKLKSKFNSKYNNTLYIAQELNLHFAHPSKITLNGTLINDKFIAKNSNELIIIDDFTNKKIIIKSDKNWDIFANILYTISKSESGFDKLAQEISIFFTKEFSKKIEFKFNIEVLNV